MTWKSTEVSVDRGHAAHSGRDSLTKGRLSAQPMAESLATWAPLILHQTLALQTHMTRAQKEAKFPSPHPHEAQGLVGFAVGQTAALPDRMLETLWHHLSRLNE